MKTPLSCFHLLIALAFACSFCLKAIAATTSGDFSRRTSTESHFNYASSDCSANVISVSPGTSGSLNAPLTSNRDAYLLFPCATADKKYIEIQLCDEIKIERIEIANFEYFSSTWKDFSVWYSEGRPRDMEQDLSPQENDIDSNNHRRDSNQQNRSSSPHPPSSQSEWKFLASFTGRNTHSIQSFSIPSSHSLAFIKYMKIEFLSHYSHEYYCPLSLIRVYGRTMIQEYRDEVFKQSQSKQISRFHSKALSSSPLIDAAVDEVSRSSSRRYPASPEKSATKQQEQNVFKDIMERLEALERHTFLRVESPARLSSSRSKRALKKKWQQQQQRQHQQGFYSFFKDDDNGWATNDIIIYSSLCTVGIVILIAFGQLFQRWLKNRRNNDGNNSDDDNDTGNMIRPPSEISINNDFRPTSPYQDFSNSDSLSNIPSTTLDTLDSNSTESINKMPQISPVKKGKKRNKL